MTKNYDKYVVMYKGKPVTRINNHLIAKQGIDDEGLEYIKQLHVERMDIENDMEARDITEVEALRSLFADWTETQYLLQAAWKFPQDKNWHPSHRLNKCYCGATMDNDDRLGTPYKVYSLDCPIHGTRSLDKITEV